MNRRAFLAGLGGAVTSPVWAFDYAQAEAQGPASGSLGFQLVDVTGPSRLAFTHNSGAYGGKLLPETLGAGCAFLDYDADGWQDILLVNGMDWPGQSMPLMSRTSCQPSAS